MTERSNKRAFTAPPADPESWVKDPDPRPGRGGDAANFSARLTVDVTPDLRGQIKIAAFQRGVTVADMLRELLAREFTPTEGGTP
ncbi:hypothetical protein GTW51_21435 [Aurantimonas aggregata]|uniref:Chromosome partitioning protein ParB n=1 Tax=Aurantimonas aggregata TaxID=2047720 RepID=A0A6L9MP71_9HYPH|nr:hypothetical protein [Aurantimonas aggregata]NDV89228.1 hypothetical protein [Aurantimonas aggregata]